jgi:hypothetical protein
MRDRGKGNVPGLWGAALFLVLLLTMLNTFGVSAGVSACRDRNRDRRRDHHCRRSQTIALTGCAPGLGTREPVVELRETGRPRTRSVASSAAFQVPPRTVTTS